MSLWQRRCRWNRPNVSQLCRPLVKRWREPRRVGCSPDSLRSERVSGKRPAHRSLLTAYFMKRYPAFDPPEYVSWSADPVLLQEFGKTIQRHPQRRYLMATRPLAELLQLYERLLLARLQDIALSRWVRQGVIS